MRLALDIGEKRTGLALELDGRVVRGPVIEHSDTAELIEELVSAVAERLDRENPFDDDLPANWAAVCDRFGPEELVVGLPLDERGELGEAAEKTKQVAEKLAAELDLPLVFIDERYSSRAARDSQLGRPNTEGTDPDQWDSMVAAELLRGHLEGAKPVEV